MMGDFQELLGSVAGIFIRFLLFRAVLQAAVKWFTRAMRSA